MTAISVRELLSSIPLSWFQHNQHMPSTILIDATATKQATDNPKHFSRAKHMETFLAWVRHVIQEGFIRTQTIPRDDNVADFIGQSSSKVSASCQYQETYGAISEAQYPTYWRRIFATSRDHQHPGADSQCYAPIQIAATSHARTTYRDHPHVGHRRRSHH